MSFEIPSFAKINWTLEILGRRADGYHELRTMLQTVDVCDQLQFALAEKTLALRCDNPAVPCDETNLIYRAAVLLRELSGCDKGARIDLQKRIPMGAGLGGGSSNAAITLLALAQLWELDVAPRDLFRLGSQLGSDVPFFFSAARASASDAAMKSIQWPTSRQNICSWSIPACLFRRVKSMEICLQS